MSTRTQRRDSQWIFLTFLLILYLRTSELLSSDTCETWCCESLCWTAPFFQPPNLSGAKGETASSAPEHSEALQHIDLTVYSLAATCMPGDARNRSYSLCKEDSSTGCEHTFFSHWWSYADTMIIRPLMQNNSTKILILEYCRFFFLATQYLIYSCH